ncbi:MAG TPA: ABC transporter permease [Chloroflexota bacterium]|nr:ABC transporter permease [Chloroflexota bacterium]
MQVPTQVQAARAATGDAEQEALGRLRESRRRQWLLTLAIRVGSLAVVLAAWEVVGRQINPILFAPPSAVARAAVELIGSGELWRYLSQSLLVLAYGFALGAVLGVAAGLLMARFWVLDVALETYITALYSIPMVAVVPVLVLWLGFDVVAKTAVIFLFTFFPITINTYQGVKHVDPRLIEVGRAFRANETRLWQHIVLPAALPFIIAGLRLAIGRGLIAMVFADIYTAISGIGYLIVRYASIYQVDKMFVPVVTLGVLGVSLTGLLRLVERRLAPWLHQESHE